MKALSIDKTLSVVDVPIPRRHKGEALIRVTMAGICNTDHEILKGYVPGFTGIPGHEFIGYVEEADDNRLAGKRVTAEINCACGTCDFCRQGLQRHCPSRTVLGINNRSGAFAEFITVPQENIIQIPDDIPDNRAIFIEPLAAACEILEQAPLAAGKSVLVIGDGKLGQLVALVISETKCTLTVAGKHKNKLKLLDAFGVENTISPEAIAKKQYDVVVEASGNPAAFETAVAAVKPRGTLVIKSTYAEKLKFNPSSLIVNEITMIGSRCGRFPDAVDFILRNHPPLEELISAEFPLEKGPEAFEYSARSEALKVLFKMS